MKISGKAYEAISAFFNDATLRHVPRCPHEHPCGGPTWISGDYFCRVIVSKRRSKGQRMFGSVTLVLAVGLSWVSLIGVSAV